MLLALATMLPSAALPGGGAGAPLANEPAQFEDVTAEAGFPDTGWARVAWGDCDGDGLEDLLLNGNALYRNDGDGTFTDVTAAAGISRVASNGGVWADYDNDGDLDIYSTVSSFTARDVLWRNDGKGRFADVSELSGEIYDFLPTEGAAWGDYDDDGYVDMYVANYENWRQEGDTYGIGTPDVLYHNEGNGRFTNASSVAGVELQGEPYCSRGVVWSDYDDDGDQDIYVSNYRLDPNLLWRNSGNGTFVNFARQAGAEGYAAETVPGSEARYGHSIGSDFGDYDNDGWMDLYVSNLAHPRFIMFSDKSMLLRNQGDGTFGERFYGSGIDYCETSSDPAWGDFDNDGDLDLFFTAVYDGRHSRLFRNDGRGRFSDATADARASVNNGWGCAWCDYDHDGDLDLAVGSGSGFRLLRNGGNDNHWLEVELVGTTCNRAAIGARVRVVAGALSMVRDLQGGRGTTSQNMLAAHFGLEGYDGEVEVSVRWPGETEYVRMATSAVDRRVRVVQPESEVDAAVSLGLDPEYPLVGEVVRLTATVANVGDRTVSSAKVRFSVTGQGPLGADVNVVGPIAPGETRTAETVWQPMAEGNYEVLADLVEVRPPDTDPSNDLARASCPVGGANRPPTARLMVEPTTAPPGLEVSFDGTASTDDSAVRLYLFEYGDGAESGWQTSPRSTHAYGVPGQYLAQLTVKDDRGTISSNLATSMVTITTKGYRPLAFIESVSPVPARAGEPVMLRGHGVAAEDASIAAHSWNSSLDGHLGDAATITVDRLGVGSHTIIYKVQDDRGLWSEPATVELDVLVAEGTWTVAFTTPSEGAAIEHETIVVRGVASYTAGDVEYVEYRVDNDGWARADGTGSWSFELDASALSDGYHTLRARAFSLGTTSPIAFLNVTVDADGGGQSPGGGLAGMLVLGWGAVAILAVVVAGVVAVALVARSRRARRRARRPIRGSAGASPR